jgi:hypothetical protein
MTRYRTIAVGETVQWTGNNAYEIWAFIGHPELIANMELKNTDTPYIPTKEGNVLPEIGDRITKIDHGIFEVSKKVV